MAPGALVIVALARAVTAVGAAVASEDEVGLKLVVVVGQWMAALGPRDGMPSSLAVATADVDAENLVVVESENLVVVRAEHPVVVRAE